MAQGTLALHLRREQAPLNAPSSLQALIEHESFQMVFSRPLRQRLCLSEIRQPTITAFIIGLLFSRGPVAVLSAVRSVVVTTLNRASRIGAKSHIAQERREIVTPLPGHHDSSPSIVMVGLAVLVVAAFGDPSPRLIFSGQALAVAGIARNQGLTAQTSTTARSASVDALGVHGNDATAGAKAFQLPVVVGVARHFADNSPTTEHFSYQMREGLTHFHSPLYYYSGVA